EIFKTRHRRRLNEIQDLAGKGTNATIDQVFARFEQKGVSQEAAGQLVDTVPRGLYRDQIFTRAMESRRLLLNDAKISAKFFGAEDAVMGADLDRILIQNAKAAEGFKAIALQRARVLAQHDVKEYKMVLNKMHIIEAEVIQRLHLDENLK